MHHPICGSRPRSRTSIRMEADGMVSRKVHPTVPPQVEYGLTELGSSLAVPIMQLAAWVLDHRGAIEAHLRSTTKRQSTCGNSPAAFPAVPCELHVCFRGYGLGSTMFCIFPASRRGGAPKRRLYSRLNCETLS
ncbi:winged helix-turn-helix transcriptional regulator [Mesorhizobium sp. J8]|uniref:winged helix-turn-helix transcriptional regulator n=1 Tax=Mesorhizobium sp. J8 TaxID=2777475 RepID=UPI001CD8774D|nr:helix-turn-helix domain-containing protein [Mesorhizobium sp. J8]